MSWITQLTGKDKRRESDRQVKKAEAERQKTDQLAGEYLSYKRPIWKSQTAAALEAFRNMKGLSEGNFSDVSPMYSNRYATMTAQGNRSIADTARSQESAITSNWGRRGLLGRTDTEGSSRIGLTNYLGGLKSTENARVADAQMDDFWSNWNALMGRGRDIDMSTPMGTFNNSAETYDKNAQMYAAQGSAAMEALKAALAQAANMYAGGV
jgi:hypothetical protein